jgi:hypothetical protein
MFAKAPYLQCSNYGDRANSTWMIKPMRNDERDARWFVPILIALIVLATSSAIVGERGIKDNQHRGAVPAQVAMLDADLYLIRDGAQVTANDICLNGATDAAPVERNHRIESLNADLIMCYAKQQWSVTAGPPRSFIPDGLVHTLLAPWYWGVLVGLLLGFFPYGYVRAHRWLGKWEKEQRANERKGLENAKAALIGQWTRASSLDLDDPAYISDADFEKRLGELDAKINA